MHPPLEHIDVCLPVTALKALNLGDARLILQGQGPYSRLIDDGSGKILAELKTFKRNNVHGFIVLDQKDEKTGNSYVQFLAWGGESLRILDLYFARSEAAEGPEVSLTPVSAEYLAPDWILAGCAPDSINGVDRAYVLTAHNSLLGLYVVHGGSPKYPKSIHLQQLVAGVKSILYSAETISYSASRVLIAAGTVFGEVIVWSCFLDESVHLRPSAVGSIHHFFTGHEGSVFGVRISPAIASLPGRHNGRLLASCSDDRTVRIWDISDCEDASPNDPSAYSTDGFELRSTGFGGAAIGDGLGSESCVASAFGHKARIWSVHFLPTGAEDRSSMSLLSRGEDATCIVWNLSWEPSSSPRPKFSLGQISSWHNHTGKHIWSLCMRSTAKDTTVYTGGADGAVKSFKVEADAECGLVLPNRNNSITASAGPGISQSRVDKSVRAFTFVTPEHFLTTTIRGEVQVCWISAEASTESIILKETLFLEEDLSSYCAITSLPQCGIALLGNSQGLIRLYNHNTRSLLRIVESGPRPLVLFALDYKRGASDSHETLFFISSHHEQGHLSLVKISLSEGEVSQMETITLALPHSFGVTCASLICGNRYVALGNTHGSLVLYRVANTMPIQQPIWNRKIHSREGISCISSFSSLYGENSPSLNYFLTCGRSGVYCVHEVEAEEDPQNLPTVRTIHRSNATRTIEIEGAYIDRQSKDLMLYGFHGKEFVLWNETTQSEIVRRLCGGAHRRWAFQPNPDEPGSGMFIWLQKNLNVLQTRGDANRTLRAGAHGREIKAMDVAHTADGPLFATGAEDTIVRIFAPTEPNEEKLWGSFKCLRVLKKHQVGLQQVRWSKKGNYLFTSGGSEEFIVWQIRSIPLFGLATNAVASVRDDPFSDLRVTSFDVLQVDENSSDGSFLFCLVYSNSTLKIFHYSSTVDGGNFTLLAEGTYTSNCLTEACFLLRDSTLSLLTASTDGYFTFWNLTSVLEPYYTISSALRLKQPIGTFPITPGNISCEYRYQAHSNSIKCLELAHISDAVSLVVAAGDDNALTLSILNTNFTSTEAGDATTITIPDAHAACITTGKILKQRQCPDKGTMQAVIATSGNDHRVKIWCAEVDAKKIGADAIQVQMIADRYSSVADISSLGLICEASGETKLLVCGVGMEMMGIQLP
ncbi:WD40-repeat-containing domain protein [Aspergillus pseudonomiae]|uniref:WD40-repeat-containing domain protein n=1 Tax=Aspergillus pseudonomiae TaxID=1506151 RepID=A0A5N6HZ03_9EURO|nr:WD40-repeat-containing domain protein [Aspergillus pseudonomiae]KAB8259655.1 WD40-repeat-containing domain protein [Aspergillus pseudonomiae]KAE8399469.1 WD40-repeat-containing domain protein [Aspergillus pseudonomiae]